MKQDFHSLKQGFHSLKHPYYKLQKYCNCKELYPVFVCNIRIQYIYDGA